MIGDYYWPCCCCTSSSPRSLCSSLPNIPSLGYLFHLDLMDGSGHEEIVVVGKIDWLIVGSESGLVKRVLR